MRKVLMRKVELILIYVSAIGLGYGYQWLSNCSNLDRNTIILASLILFTLDEVLKD